MNTHDRMEIVRKKLGLKMSLGYPNHSALDIFDEVARFNSRRGSYGCGNYDVNNYLGARLARLERHVFLDPKNVTHLRGKKTARGWRQRAKYFFWLGAAAEAEQEGAPTIVFGQSVLNFTLDPRCPRPEIQVQTDAPGG